MRRLFFWSLFFFTSPLFASTWFIEDPYSNIDRVFSMRRDGAYLYVGGEATNPANSFYHECRIERRNFPASSLLPGFGSGGVITVSSTAEDMGFTDMVVNGSSLYVLVIGSTTWLQKRDKVTGALDPSFGTAGQVGLSSRPIHLATDGAALYLAGSVGSAADPAALLEKRSLSTGSLISAFGSGGQVLMDPTTNRDSLHYVGVTAGMVVVGGTFNDQTYAAATARGFMARMDANSGVLDAGFGAAGFLSTTGNVVSALDLEGADYIVSGSDEYSSKVFLERRAQSDGSLVASYGSAGVVEYDTSNAYDFIFDSVNDGLGGIYSVCSDTILTFDHRWHVMKTFASDGSLDPSFGTGGIYTLDPGTDYDESDCLLLDAPYLYVGGTDVASGSNNRWRVEVLAVGATPTQSPTLSASSTPSQTPSVSPTFSATLTPTQTPSASPTSSASPAPSQTPSVTPTYTVSATPSASPSFTPAPAYAPARVGKVFSYPNPFRPGAGRTITLRFDPSPNAKIELYDLAARKVGEISQDQIHSSSGVAFWDGKLYNNNYAAPGLYLVLLRGDNGILTTKLTVIR